MSERFNEILKNIISDTELKEEINSLVDSKDVYKVFKREGYEYNEENFNKDLLIFLEKSVSKLSLSESELNNIGGGHRLPIKPLAGILSFLVGTAGTVSATKVLPSVHSENLTHKVQNIDSKSSNKKLLGVTIGLGGMGVGIGALLLYLALTNDDSATSDPRRPLKFDSSDIRTQLNLPPAPSWLNEQPGSTNCVEDNAGPDAFEVDNSLAVPYVTYTSGMKTKSERIKYCKNVKVPVGALDVAERVTPVLSFTGSMCFKDSKGNFYCQLSNYNESTEWLVRLVGQKNWCLLTNTIPNKHFKVAMP